jgi:hypothetical protein
MHAVGEQVLDADEDSEAVGVSGFASHPVARYWDSKAGLRIERSKPAANARFVVIVNSGLPVGFRLQAVPFAALGAVAAPAFAPLPPEPTG